MDTMLDCVKVAGEGTLHNGHNTNRRYQGKQPPEKREMCGSERSDAWDFASGAVGTV